MPDSVHLFHMHALLDSDYAILTYILHFFALCRGPKSGGMAQYFHPKYVPGCACLNGHSILVTAWNYSTSVFERCALLTLIFIKSFIYDKIYRYISVSVCAWMYFSCQKGEFDRFFNRLDRPVEESPPDPQPDRPVDPTGFHLWCSYRAQKYEL